MSKVVDADMQCALDRCNQAARKGQKIAQSERNSLEDTLRDAGDEIESTIEIFSNSSEYNLEMVDLLHNQLIDIQSAFDNLSSQLDADLSSLSRSPSKFSISLFGQTMTGKSTLMEILTHGNGKSIGKGAQRTTRSVRKYTWKGLEITDVPGIGAFDGQVDDEIAYTAAKSADLIIFLLSDNAPDALEADWFSRIIELGKPVLGVINVKRSIFDDDEIEDIEEDISEAFESERLNTIRDTFLDYAPQFGQDWKNIPFVYVHLRSAYLAQTVNDSERAHRLYSISRFGYLKKRLCRLVSEKGEFLCIKKFIDAVSSPVLNAEETLLTQCLTNSAQGRTILAKKRNLKQWRDRFKQSGLRQCDSFIEDIKNQLSSEVFPFAEDHFDDRNASTAWNNLVKSLHIETQYDVFFNSLVLQVDDKIMETSREISFDLDLTVSLSQATNLCMGRIIDLKRVWTWGTQLSAGILGIGAGFAKLLGASIASPLGVAAVAVEIVGTIGSLIFKSRNKREHMARKKLEDKLRQHIDKICKSLRKELYESFDHLIYVRLDALIKEISNVNSVVFALADTQKKLAWHLNDRFLNLNKILVTEALAFLGADGLVSQIDTVGRIPGNCNLIQLHDGKKFPVEQRNLLKHLLSEFIFFVYPSDDKKVFISRIMGKDVERQWISVEESIGVAHIHHVDFTHSLENRARLAQQLTYTAITK